MGFGEFGILVTTIRVLWIAYPVLLDIILKYFMAYIGLVLAERLWALFYD